jgi:hypothetical protein
MASTLNQEPPDRIGRIVHRRTDRELHLAAGQLVGDGARVGQRPPPADRAS